MKNLLIFFIGFMCGIIFIFSAIQEGKNKQEQEDHYPKGNNGDLVRWKKNHDCKPWDNIK